MQRYNSLLLPHHAQAWQHMIDKTGVHLTRNLSRVGKLLSKKAIAVFVSAIWAVLCFALTFGVASQFGLSEAFEDLDPNDDYGLEMSIGLLGLFELLVGFIVVMALFLDWDEWDNWDEAKHGHSFFSPARWLSPMARFLLLNLASLLRWPITVAIIYSGNPVLFTFVGITFAVDLLLIYLGVLLIILLGKRLAQDCNDAMREE